jgi:hypothetical protein
MSFIPTTEQKRRYNRNWYLKNRIKKNEGDRKHKQEYYLQNRERILQRSKDWAKRNPGHCNARNAAREALKLQATPKWLTKEQKQEIKQLYVNCPKGFHVDHIHPLRGKGFCGLHVPWNLQYLLASENISKGNRI